MSISVIIPAYNAEGFIKETIESVLRQTLPADDILVVDDGSTDSTAAVASAFPPPVRVLTIPNSKLGGARNFGVSQVSTEWVAFVDADDLWKPNKLERQLGELARNPAANLCYTGRVKFTMKDGTMRFGSIIPGPPLAKIRDELFKRGTFVPSSVVIRRSTLLEIGCFSPDPEVAEDWDLWLRLVHAGAQFAVCPEPLLLYRIHGASITSDGARLLAKNTRAFREHILPHLSGLARLLAINRFYGENQAAAAGALRGRRDPRCIPLIVKSILHLPFEGPYHYRALAGMVVALLTGRMKPRS